MKVKASRICRCFFNIVNDESVDRLESRLIYMNSMARILRSENANVPVDTVLNLGAFDLDQVLQNRPTFLEPEYPIYFLNKANTNLPLRKVLIQICH